MTKEELAIEVIDRLKKEYPLADCTLDYDEILLRISLNKIIEIKHTAVTNTLITKCI